MKTQERQLQIDHLKEKANVAKVRLMEISDELYQIGAIRKAQSLESIISRLEHWQNCR